VTLDTNAKVEQIKRVIDSAGAVVAPATEQLQQQMRDALGNQDGLTAFDYATSGTDAEQLPSNAVPDGVSVLLQAPESNAAMVYVGSSGEQPIEMQPSGTVTVDVSDTSAVYVRANSGGDGLGVLFEDG